MSKLFASFLLVENSLGFGTNLDGGNSNIFYVHPYLGKMNPF